MLTRRKKIAFSLIALSFPAMLVFLGFEMTLRIKAANTRTNEARRVIDSKLGWRPTPSLVREGDSSDAIGQKYHFRMTQDAHGFRLWGDVNTTKPRVFVLGDSYTQADDIDDQQTFHAILAQRFPGAEFWAFGCSGYGTYQQMMILQEVQPQVRPDVLVLQLSSNDVVNNLAELESCMPFLTTPAPRPYLQDDGTVRFAMAQRHRGLAGYSKAIASISDRIETLTTASEQWVPGQMRRYTIRFKSDDFDQILDKAVVKTADLLRQMKKVVGPNTRVIAFFDEDVEILTNALKQACLLADLPLVESVGKAISDEEGKRGNFCYRTRDFWHWNNQGHEVVATVLEPYLSKALEEKYPESAKPSAKSEKLAKDSKKIDLRK
jgi:hypothetical protein